MPDQQKNTLNNSNLNVGGNLNIGDTTNHIYKNIKEEKSTNWKKWTAIIIGFTAFLASIAEFTGYSIRDLFQEEKPKIAKPITIKVLDLTGKPITNGTGILSIQSKSETKSLWINQSGRVSSSFLEDTIRIQLQSKEYEAMVLDSSYQISDGVITFFVKKKEVTPVKKTKTTSKRTIKIDSKYTQAANVIKQYFDNNKDWKRKVVGNINMELNHSGEFVKVKGDYFQYTGGIVEIKVNHEICCCAEMGDMKIDLKGSRNGNSMPILERQLTKKIEQLITQNLDDVIKKIKECMS